MLDIHYFWKYCETTNSLKSAETSDVFHGSTASDSHDFDVIFLISSLSTEELTASCSLISSCRSLISLISLAFSSCFNAIFLTKFTTSSDEEELHELVSPVVDCASASNDIKTDRQITVNTRVKLPDLDMSAWYHTLMVNWLLQLTVSVCWCRSVLSHARQSCLTGSYAASCWTVNRL